MLGHRIFDGRKKRALSINKAAGTSESSVYKILKERKKGLYICGYEKNLFSTSKEESLIKVDSFTGSAIKRKIREFYSMKKYPERIFQKSLKAK